MFWYSFKHCEGVCIGLQQQKKLDEGPWGTYVHVTSLAYSWRCNECMCMCVFSKFSSLVYKLCVSYSCVAVTWYLHIVCQELWQWWQVGSQGNFTKPIQRILRRKANTYHRGRAPYSISKFVHWLLFREILWMSLVNDEIPRCPRSIAKLLLVYQASSNVSPYTPSRSEASMDR